MNLANRLLKNKALNQEKLSQALDRQKESRGFLVNHLGELGVKEQNELAEFVAPSPPVPETFADIGLPEKLLAQLFLKHAFYSHAFTLRDMSDALKVPAHLLDQLVEYLKQQKLIDISPRDLFRPSPTHLATEIRYTLSDSGKKVAEQELEFNSYVGPVPVSLEDYWVWVEGQTIQLEEIESEQLREAFKD